jgi:hypothetical protein
MSPILIIFAESITLTHICMNLLDFISTYPDEESCRLRFKSIRDQQGVICPHCEH